MAEEHRQKGKQFLLRLDDFVYDTLTEKAIAAKLKKTAFLAKIILESEIVVIDSTWIKELSNEINKIGVNINQIVHHVNARGGGCSKNELMELHHELTKISEMVYEAIWEKKVQ
jgi:hypothetical protein